MEGKKFIDCPGLPPGWKKEEVVRKSGLSAGRPDVYYYRFVCLINQGKFKVCVGDFLQKQNKGQISLTFPEILLIVVLEGLSF